MDSIGNFRSQRFLLRIEVWELDDQAFYLKFDFSTSKTFRGQILLCFAMISYVCYVFLCFCLILLCFLVISRHYDSFEGCHLVGILPTDLPELSKPKVSRSKSRKTPKLEVKHFFGKKQITSICF